MAKLKKPVPLVFGPVLDLNEVLLFIEDKYKMDINTFINEVSQEVFPDAFDGHIRTIDINAIVNNEYDYSPIVQTIFKKIKLEFKKYIHKGLMTFYVE